MKQVSEAVRDAVVRSRVTPAEKQRLERLALECDVTLSNAMRVGTELYLRQLKEHQEIARRELRLPIATS